MSQRRRVLFLGTAAAFKAARFGLEDETIHAPIIQLKSLPIAQHILDDLSEYSHIVLTSPNAVHLFFQHIAPKDCVCKKIFSVGQTTSLAIESLGLSTPKTASYENQEGIVSMLRLENLRDAYFLLPRALKTRSAIDYFFKLNQIRYKVCTLYKTVVNPDFMLPDLHQFDEIVFTSPSTVQAFLAFRPLLPKKIVLTSKGEITRAAMLADAFSYEV